MGRPSLIYAVLQRLDALMAIGESRHAAKHAIRVDYAARGEHAPWTLSTGCIHSYATRAAYQEHVLHFVTWARTQQGVRTLADLDARAEELAARYLTERIILGKSPHTLQAERSALRLFFGQPQLAKDVVIPRRTRAGITQNRGTTQSAHHFQPANHQPLLRFCEGTGLRRSELVHLLVKDIAVIEGEELRIIVTVFRGKGGKRREVAVRPGYERVVLDLIMGRDPEALVFAHIPDRLRVHVERRKSAQGRYQDLSGRPLPDAAGRLQPASYDHDVALRVSQTLGHNRVDIMTRHYLR